MKIQPISSSDNLLRVCLGILQNTRMAQLFTAQLAMIVNGNRGNKTSWGLPVSCR
ncbi:MAG: hypothetical protein RLZZ136_670 [Pseudomonadota bacterium]